MNINHDAMNVLSQHHDQYVYFIFLSCNFTLSNIKEEKKKQNIIPEKLDCERMVQKPGL